MKLNSYMSAYLDRRMGSIIEDWQLSTKGDFKDLIARFKTVQADVAELKSFEQMTNKRIADMEERVRKLKERQP